MRYRVKLDRISDTLKNADSIKISDVPNIDLYMDQLLTFINTKLSDMKRDDKSAFITNTMVNNYSKSKMLSPVIKKKYNVRHVLELAVAGQLKNILSIQDLCVLMSCFSDNDSFRCMYERFLNEQTALRQNTENIINDSVDSFNGKSKDDREILAEAAISLATEAHYKALLSEKLIDILANDPEYKEEGRKKHK